MFYSVLLSVECYDPETEGWFFVPSLPEPVFGASAAALGSRIIVAGGIGSHTEKPSVLSVQNTVYSFNPASNGLVICLCLHPCIRVLLMFMFSYVSKLIFYV